jgi:hypothetical protein
VEPGRADNRYASRRHPQLRLRHQTEPVTWYDLNDRIDGPGWVLVTANRINDSAQILGAGFLGGELRDLLLSPHGQSPNAVPDLGLPARMLLAVLLAAGALMFLRRF